jgi:hypothetical protein
MSGMPPEYLFEVAVRLFKCSEKQVMTRISGGLDG